MCRSALVLLAVLFSFPVEAKNQQCYSAAELEAEMLVRLHSELMVVTLSCRTSSTGQPLPAVYTLFTKNHLDLIKGSEKSLIAWYSRNGVAAPQSKFDKLRTSLANAYSQQIADMTPVVFCDRYRDYASTAGQWGAKEVSSEVQNLIKTYPAHAPLCEAAAEKGKTVAKAKNKKS
ncbi:MAG: hypothetical protein WBK91_04615 [Alphaproteobacteria bacterium]